MNTRAAVASDQRYWSSAGLHGGRRCVIWINTHNRR